MGLALAVLTTAALAGMAGIALVNAAAFPRLRRSSGDHGTAKPPRVSVLIPARDEAAVIGRTVRALLDQAYPDVELIVLDDDSSDGTTEVARAAGTGDERLRVLKGAPLPPGWVGKNWACHQLARAASGDLLVFTDADVRWALGALAALVAEAATSQAGLLTVWPTQVTETWGERLVVPLIGLVVVAYLPAPLVHHSPWAAFAAANGQCLCFRRETYDAIGGHAAVRAEIVEDIVFSRRVKAAGERLRMADGSGLIACRMYDSWPAARDGFAKNIIAGYGGSVFALALATLFHWLVFLFPWFWLARGRPAPGWPWWPLSLGLGGIGIRALAARVTRQRARDALLMPLSVAAMTAIAAKAVWWRWRGGPEWKGRRLPEGPKSMQGPRASGWPRYGA